MTLKFECYNDIFFVGPRNNKLSTRERIHAHRALSSRRGQCRVAACHGECAALVLPLGRFESCTLHDKGGIIFKIF